MHLKYTVDTVYSNMICTRYLLYVVKMFWRTYYDT